MARPLSSVALALCTAVLGAPPAFGQSARASVRASVTILDPVGVTATSSPTLRSGSGGGLVMDGTFEVTSPVPHVVTSSASATGIDRGGRFTRPCAASRRTVARRVHLEVVRPVGDGPVTLVYTVAVVL